MEIFVELPNLPSGSRKKFLFSALTIVVRADFAVGQDV